MQVARAVEAMAAAGAAAVEALAGAAPADIVALAGGGATSTAADEDEPDEGVPLGLGPSQGFDTDDLVVAPLRDIRAPAMYTALAAPAGSQNPNQTLSEPPPLNLRASWLAGRPARGDALLAAVRLRPNEWGTPAVKYGLFALADYAPWAAATLPVGAHGARIGMPLLACLPQAYTCALHIYSRRLASSQVQLAGRMCDACACESLYSVLLDIIT